MDGNQDFANNFFNNHRIGFLKIINRYFVKVNAYFPGLLRKRCYNNFLLFTYGNKKAPVFIQGMSFLFISNEFVHPPAH